MRLLRYLLAGAALLALVPAVLVVKGAWSYWRLEKSVVGKMDQYWLSITHPGREEYLLEGDEVFEVPYMASKLSVEAAPTRLYDVKGRLMGEFAVEKGVYVQDPEELPSFLKKALVATEDAGFYEHHGVEYKAIARAMWVNLRRMRRAQGGSTLTQQLAKMMFTTRQKTFGRKFFELLCARKLETKFTKDQILLMYLDFAYFGHGCFGVESAARYYFGRPARDLELAQAALLAGMVANPAKYSPFDNPELAKARHHTVLARMARRGYLPAAAAERHWEEFWRERARLKAPESSFWRMTLNEAPYAVEAVRRALLKEFRKERILRGGLRVRTTFDLDVQKAAQAAMRAGLTADGLEGGLAAVRPEDGAVLALVGGSGFNFGNQLNRATDIARPMGSSVKPFVFAVALESGRFKPEDLLEDSPIRFKTAGRVWAPQNYDRKYYGKVTLDLALRRSLNSAAIRLLGALDIDAVRRVLAEATGAPLERFPRNLTLALGTADLSPLESAAAFAVFANGGRAVRPWFIASVEDRDGKVIQERAAPVESKVVLSSGTCAALISILEGVLREDGTAHAAALRAGFNLPAAGKTGTTNEYRDAWFAGVTPDLAASVWVGHDDMRVALGRGETGGRIAAPIWLDFVKRVYRDRPTRPFSN